MARYVTVEITRKDIREGVQRSATKCAGALAITRSGLISAFEGATAVAVGPGEIRFIKDATRTWRAAVATRKTPKKLREFINAFDSSRRSVKPIKFRLSI